MSNTFAVETYSGGRARIVSIRHPRRTSDPSSACARLTRMSFARFERLHPLVERTDGRLDLRSAGAPWERRILPNLSARCKPAAFAVSFSHLDNAIERCAERRASGIVETRARRSSASSARTRSGASGSREENRSERDVESRRTRSNSSASCPVATPPMPTIGSVVARAERRAPRRARPASAPVRSSRRCPRPSVGLERRRRAPAPRSVLTSERPSAPAPPRPLARPRAMSQACGESFA